MMVWGAILGWGVLYGLLLSVGFTVVLLASGLVAPDFGVHNYPPAIRERYGAKSRRGRLVTGVAGAVVAVLVIGVVTAGLLQVRAVTGELGFVTAFATAAVIMHTFNIIDLLVLDCLCSCCGSPISWCFLARRACRSTATCGSTSTGSSRAWASARSARCSPPSRRLWPDPRG
jgi:tetrahydromethanopterin S-methyltransferase subunit F